MYVDTVIVHFNLLREQEIIEWLNIIEIRKNYATLTSNRDVQLRECGSKTIAVYEFMNDGNE